MSMKESVITLVRELPDDSSIDAILDAVKALAPPGTVKSRAGVDDGSEEVSDDDWMAVIAEDWADDLGDSRQDIYESSLGDSSHEPG